LRIPLSVKEDGFNRFVEFEKRADRGILQGLEFHEDRPFTIVLSVGDVFNKQIETTALKDSAFLVLMDFSTSRRWPESQSERLRTQPKRPAHWEQRWTSPAGKSLL
jgi:hypothetical protein